MTNKSAKESNAEFKVPPQFKFQDAEKVLCFHGPLIYEAKCMQSRYDDKEKVNQYFIHYSGWNKSWDEWVPETRVLKYNETNIQKQKELHKAQKNEPKSKKAKKRSITGKDVDAKDKDGGDNRSVTPIQEKHGGKASSATPSSSQESASDSSKKKRARVDVSVESEEQFLSKVEIKIKMPDELKPFLFDDWQNITVHKKLLKFPPRHTVEDVLENYLKQRGGMKAVTPHKEEARLEVINGLREYFNFMLSSQLLYEEERDQYIEVIEAHADTPVYKIYGPVHLLRLFTRLGRALAYTKLDEKGVQQVTTYITDFLKFLLKNASTYFSQQDYVSTTTT